MHACRSTLEDPTGVIIPGETGWTLDLASSEPRGLHEYQARLTCAGVVSCGSLSVPVVIDTSQDPGPVASTEIDGILMVRREGAGLRLAWEERAAAPTGHSIYSGTIASFHPSGSAVRGWYDHLALDCHLVRTPPDGEDLFHDTPMPTSDTYFLVTPANCQDEGIAGRDFLGRTDPTSAVGSACGPMP